MYVQACTSAGSGFSPEDMPTQVAELDVLWWKCAADCRIQRDDGGLKWWGLSHFVPAKFAKSTDFKFNYCVRQTGRAALTCASATLEAAWEDRHFQAHLVRSLCIVLGYPLRLLECGHTKHSR